VLSVVRAATTESEHSAVMIFLCVSGVTRARHGIFEVTIEERTMKLVKNITIAIAAIFLFSVVFLNVAPAQGEAQPSDSTAYYKAKCVACHGQKAEKKFDASLTDEQYIDAILKGKKPEKPPNMPAYGEKGVTAEQAKALLEHMKQLRASQ
jgi:mono/diheme cytochrome c family protein